MQHTYASRPYAAITAIGGYVPQKRRTNFDLEQVCDTSNEWIIKRTGIKERRILDKDLATSDMAVMAIQDLCLRYEKNLADIEAILVATSTPDVMMPATANIIARKLALKNVWAFDMNAACSGFLYALDMGASLIESGRYKNVLVVGADNISAFVDIKDRSTNILFGDGAGVVWLEPSSENGIIDAFMQSNGDGREFLNIEGGGSLYPANNGLIEVEKKYIRQDGKVVFKQAIQSMSDACNQVLSRNNMRIDQVNWLVPHQANKRIIDAVGKEINIPEGRTLSNIEYLGNTIAATIPLCIWENIKRIQKGDLLMLTAFGAGFSWGASLLRWAI
ncbi:3-oxoacyl-[acyl-carrier-protein] synthase III [Sphingobacterium allocomposti]|uniref:Beta-ketoacyl-[acyl-carrier-protein] synthase III n=1 Tax=Sphingobacterium allocomposti TaxID=415956 RepID=A0A5S5DQP8_9SPHI|nr:beta-ketoacyl-ACP synthase III [Sphingobacterium composti Yoo et al. 2007 non Ten et al. 2007]TYP97172.1 3-oxoacyl-[acyl-carrier-protein] synthase III [Sphingobacterium composti Yoo et al. 2007 non Ten et al. 2007]HLS96123.1 beta-ketoacyl-ACP synthase III [Sphingobacterium sp.]